MNALDPSKVATQRVSVVHPTFTWWRLVTQPIGDRFQCTWETLFHRFTDPVVTLPASVATLSKAEMQRVKKENLPGWAPALFDGKRSLENFVSAAGIVLDLDDESPCFDSVVEAFSPLAGFVHTSPSHRPSQPRCRVILPTSRPVIANEYNELWTWAAARVLGVDRSTRDPSRLWYVPAVVEGLEYQAAKLPGQTLDVDFVLWALRHVSKPEHVATVTETQAREVSDTWEEHAIPSGVSTSTPSDRTRDSESSSHLIERAEKLAMSCPVAISGARGYATTFTLAAKLVRGLELTPEQAATAMMHWNARCVPPWSAADLLRIARRADAVATQIPRGALRGQTRRRAP
jgi:hypothetical protein